ncbi:MAG: hypothetical protein ACD_40C00248G0002 [uncultured bacterium]|nr:MAG: hypothetical protein ACD_40C00248G0002 [uncultured bacterium]
MEAERVASSGMGISSALGSLLVRRANLFLMRSVIEVSSESVSSAERVASLASSPSMWLALMVSATIFLAVILLAWMSVKIATRAEMVVAVSSPSTMRTGSTEVDGRS